MTCATVCELGQFFLIIASAFAVTGQTPAHVHHLWILSNPHVGHVAVAPLAIQSRRNMRPVRKMDEVRHLGDRHPGNLLIVCNVIFQDRQFGARIRNLHLLVTAPAFCKRGQPGRRST